MANANARKKLDDYHTKVLRELGALPCNKNCFDCNQRGPTYVNVTIGSFVCSKCSGILRGLTPPHRVKSISMTTFTPEEVDQLKSRGNDYCRRVWLGLCDNSIQYKDEQQVKDFMIDKYERKRYYIDPSTLSSSCKPTTQPQPPTTSTPSTQAHSISKAIPLRTTQITLTNGSTPSTTSSSRVPNQSNGTSTMFPSSTATPATCSSNNNTSSALFQVDFNNAPKDPFSSNTTNSSSSSVIQRNSNSRNSQSQQAQPQQQQPSFANFDNAVFLSVQSIAGMTEPSRKPMSNPLEIQKEDKYAALKDLDSIMKQQQQQGSTQSSHTVENQNLHNGDVSTTNGWNGGVFGSPSTSSCMFSSATSNGLSNGSSAFGSPNNLNGSAFSSTPSSNHVFGNSFNTTNGSSGFGSPATNGSMFGSPNGRTVDSPYTNGVDVANPFNNANPFRVQDAWTNQGIQNGSVTNGFPMSQSLDFSSVKSQSQWPVPRVNHHIANPFMMNTATPQTTAPHHSSNPFL